MVGLDDSQITWKGYGIVRWTAAKSCNSEGVDNRCKNIFWQMSLQEIWIKKIRRKIVELLQQDSS